MTTARQVQYSKNIRSCELFAGQEREVMDAFEEIISELLERDKYWVKNSVKINTITKEDKVDLQKPSMPTPEIDLVAYDAGNNELILIEVKSFLYSGGVRKDDVIVSHPYLKGKYKILTCLRYQEILKKRLREKWEERGLINPDTQIRFGLIAGNIYGNHESDIKKHAVDNNWFYWGPRDIETKIKDLANTSYENKQINMISKILQK